MQRCTSDEYAALHRLAPAPARDVGDAAGACAAAARAPLAVITALAQRDCGGGAAPVANIIAALLPPHERASAVAVHHPDSVLWTVELGAEGDDDDDDAHADAQQAAPLVAVLIPDDMAAALAEQSSSGSSEGDSDDDAE